jgi:uncharacterized protein
MEVVNLVASEALQPAPTAQRSRIEILDSLRGIALLGILLMNIPAFSRPFGNDPTIFGETGLNFQLWYGIDWIFEGTQRALFSLLFGAGILLFMDSRSRQADRSTALDLFLRRQLWLIVFSLFDVYILLWHGDILFDYACLGLIVLAFRKLSPKALIVSAGICLIFMMARYNVDLYRDKAVVQKGEQIAAIDTTRVSLTSGQKKDLAAFTALQERSSLEGKKKRAEETIQNVTGSWASLYKDRTERYVQSLITYLYYGLWDVLFFMFLGMAFYKLGIVTGQASTKVYWYLTIIGLGVGLSLSYLRLETMLQYNFKRVASVQKTLFTQIRQKTVGPEGFL